jgi:hypothetical protein
MLLAGESEKRTLQRFVERVGNKLRQKHNISICPFFADQSLSCTYTQPFARGVLLLMRAAGA